MDRRGRTGQIVYLIHLKKDGLRKIMAYQLKIGFAE
jgi:hypothetical protein